MENEFQSVHISEKQIGLLIALVEQTLKQPDDQRQRFTYSRYFETDEIDGLANWGKVYIVDLDVLNNEGFLLAYNGPGNEMLFDVSPLGFHYYKYLMKSIGEPTERVEDSVFRYLDASAFAKHHPQTFDKWKQAEELLWGSDSQQQHTAIGHHCREAMQFFATSLVEEYQPTDVDQDITKVERRLAAVLELIDKQTSNRIVAVNKAMFQYWRALNDLVQRQEHGAQKGSDALTREDSRRLVFQTAIVLFEIDRTLQDLK